MSPKKNNSNLKANVANTKLPITREEYKKIRQFIRSGKGRFVDRNLLLVNLQTNTCVKSSDVLNFRIGNVLKDGKIIEKFWKSQLKTRCEIPLKITKTIISDLEGIVDKYTSLYGTGYFKDPDNPLFPSQVIDKQNRRYKPISYDTYRLILREVFTGLNMNLELYGTHSLRAAMPLDYYLRFGDIETTRMLFGHKSKKTTLRYIDKVSAIRAFQVRNELQFTD